MTAEKDSIKADVRLTVTRNGKTFIMAMSNVDVSDASFERAPVTVASNKPYTVREPGPYTVVTLKLHPDDHPQWYEELEWHYGPNEGGDQDPGKMWHTGCGQEVTTHDGYYVCRCGKQAPA